ncbi:MAG: hypothetical protein JWO94_1375, partial [Verrucomicrobiaceae bacterium]|nr:hypothetical protein [Verrucomicrobiaceae bacterium]
RQASLTEQRNLKMARSAHAYVRGNTRQFYEWLDSASGARLPAGPAVWICGDCHVGNLGPIADSKGQIDIQIRDLDQTVIGNPAHDLVRLGLSLASAARSSDLPGVVTAQMLEQMMEGYESAFTLPDEGNVAEVVTPRLVKRAMRSALKRKWSHLARERIKDTTPTIPLGQKFWRLSKGEQTEVRDLFKKEEVRRLVTSLHSRDSEARVEVLDAAFWVKGCSSLGRLRYAVLLKVGGDRGSLCLMDIKEAIQAVAPSCNKSEMPRDNAERVVAGAWHLSPALGERMLAAGFQDRRVFLRELLPQDLKFEIEHLSLKESIKVAKFLATVVGKAHARQMDETTRQAWRKELHQNRSKTLDAPSWLWSSVVELTVSHEGAYLEHCRRFAMNGGR